ncbi:MAG TPA: LamG-like jellyroll fold domain-containing protein [Candidatus Paceibacterota bacterium]
MLLNRHHQTISFTLLELLLVIGILGIFAVVVILVLNPAELFNQARDANRIAEILNINKAIKIYQTLGGSVQGIPNIVYISVPDTSPTCANLTLPALPSGWQYQCKTLDNFRKMDGNGWIPVNFTNISASSPFATLPVDPINSAQQNLYYAYVNGGVIESWILTTMLQSEKYLKEQATIDGGSDPGRFEVGSNATLWTTATSLVGYWDLDENAGATISDQSGNNFNGTIFGPRWAPGKIKFGIALDGTDDYAQISDNALLEPNDGSGAGNGSWTVSVWARPTNAAQSATVVAKRFSTGDYTQYQLGIHSHAMDGSAGKQASFLYRQNGGSQIGAHTTADVVDGNWHHIVGVANKSSNTMFIYVDGINMPLTMDSVGPAPWPIVNNSEPVTFGYNNGGGEYFNGTLDEVRMYNRALTEAEIQAIYDAEK